MLKEEPFDPLKFLEHQLLLTVRLDEDGSRILVYGVSGLSPGKRKQVTWVVRTYAGLLRLQLKASKPELRPSVRKLLAQGKVAIKDGKYHLR
jgi:hypothetical protein